MAALSWFDILSSARGLKAPFTKDDLAQASGIQAGPKSSPGRIASAWLTKFSAWGYVRRVGEIKGQGIRPTFQYEITEKGAAVKLREGVETRLRRLVEAVRAYAAVRGSRNEAKAYRTLLDLCGDVEAQN